MQVLRWLGLLVLAGCGGGGGGSASDPPSTTPQTPSPGLVASQLAVLYAAGDTTSEAIARAYQAARGVPEANMIALALPSRGDSLGAAEFATLKAGLDARLPAAVQATLVTWLAPSRVAGPSCSMGLTSALAFGYDAAYCGACARTRASAYYNSSTQRPWDELYIRPSMMLGAATLAEAQALINRGVAADRSFGSGGASGHGWLVRTSDMLRSTRGTDFASLAATPVGGITWHYVDNSNGLGSDFVSGQDAVMFYFTGLAAVPQLASNRWLPGAVGDSLTSYGGLLPDAGGQTPVTAWLQAGATASYGTVEEPCNFVEKFPRASVMVAQYRSGQTLIEAYWKSVQWPGQGLFVGEPLARPWAR